METFSKLGRALLLDPMAPEPLGRYDAERAHRAGVVAVDCSWNRLTARGRYPAGAAGLESLRYRRRLPWLMATNPQHYGRLGELTTAEAFGASLWLVGETQAARMLLAPFAGGAQFLEVNALRLAAYASGRSPAELEEIESHEF